MGCTYIFPGWGEGVRLFHSIVVQLLYFDVVYIYF